MSTPNIVGRYDLNDLVKLRATYVSTDGVTPADPSVVMFLVRNASGAVACYQYEQAGSSVMREATGAYFKEITANQVGSWYYRAHATGRVQANEEWSFLVDRSFIL